jgi:hypothetical protein
MAFPHIHEVSFQLVLVCSCVLAFLLNYAIFLNTSLNSALTQTICGNLKAGLAHPLSFHAFWLVLSSHTDTTLFTMLFCSQSTVQLMTPSMWSVHVTNLTPRRIGVPTLLEGRGGDHSRVPVLRRGAVRPAQLPRHRRGRRGLPHLRLPQAQVMMHRSFFCRSPPVTASLVVSLLCHCSALLAFRPVVVRNIYSTSSIVVGAAGSLAYAYLKLQVMKRSFVVAAPESQP